MADRFPAFLARAYTLKTVADYAIGDEVGITLDEASHAIAEAAAFIDSVSKVLQENG